MSEHRIYKLALPADFTYGVSPSYWSSAWGGSDTPNADNPEFGAMENILRAEGGGPGGEDVVDANNTSDYTVAWATLCGIGDLENGQFDCRGGGAGRPLKCRWQQKLKSSALGEVGISVPLVLCNGGTGGANPGVFATNIVLSFEMNQTAGANFTWVGRYRKPSGGGGFTLQPVSGSAGVADNAWHEMIATLVPATVTGAYAGAGSIGSAIVASDGSFSLTVDGVSVVSASGIPLTINIFATTNPDVYYGKTIWHGD